MTIPKLKEGSKVKNYIIHKELGAGCFGRVYEAINTADNNATIAIKCVSKQLQQTSPKAYQLFQAEKDILSKIKNENVVGFVDYFESQQVCFLCLEYCNEGDLEDYLKTKQAKRVVESEAIEYFKQILNGFRALHENNILHRDMKLPNILKHNGQLKIADLGFAKELKNDRALTATILGTPYTMAPEVLEEKPYGLTCDIYSMGVNFYQMVFGKYPFNGRSEYELLQTIKKQQINFQVPGVAVSPQMIDLLQKMLKYDVKERIIIQEIWNHPLFNQEQAYQNVGLHLLNKSKINIKENVDFYNKNQNGQQQQQQQNQQQQQQNPFGQIQNDKEQQNPFNIIEDQSSTNIINTYHQNQQIESEVKKIIGLYMSEVNTINILGKCVHASHVLPDTQINTFYPCFFMLKKLISQQKRVLDDMEAKKNVFNCQYADKLFNHMLFQNVRQDLKDRLEMNNMYFMARKFDMEDLMQQTPNPDIMAELNDKYTQTSEQFFKQTMINYYVNLQEEMNKCLKSNNVNALKFQKHIVEVLDSLDLDKFFRAVPNFNFDDYQIYRETIDFETRQKLIDQKAKIVFP